MPRLTQALTRHPVGEAGSGEAARSSPLSRAARSERKAAMAEGSPMAEGPAAKWRSIVACNWLRFIAFRVYQDGGRGSGITKRRLAGGERLPDPRIGIWGDQRKGWGHPADPTFRQTKGEWTGMGHLYGYQIGRAHV